MTASARGRKLRALRVEPPAGACSSEDCQAAAVTLCAYTDDAGGRCDSPWCERHIYHVAGIPVCRRHRETLEILTARQDTIYGISSKPRVADRSLSLTVHLAGVLRPAIETLLAEALPTWPGARIEAEDHPRPFWNSEGVLSGWELGWSIISPRGRHLRVAIRARSGKVNPSVQVVVEHMVAYDDEPSPEAIRGDATDAQLRFTQEIQRMVAETLQSMSAEEWRPV